ncbi:glycosyl transferase [Alloalcanivorax dieselolei]|nr:glycosyl transferase [Alloalcanivorax dieselolei]
MSGQFQWSAINSTIPGVGNALEEEIIVSLTTFDKRIDNVYLTIESLLQQSLKPDRIILWLSEPEFRRADVPHILTLQQQRGLEVAFCPEDLGPYKKFYYTLMRYPHSLVITVDDDMLYPHDLVDRLYRSYRAMPGVIPCLRAHGMRFDSRGEVLPYKQWEKPTSDSAPSLLTFPTGVGGVLYFPGCLDEQVLDATLFRSLCPNADDVWLKAMSLKRGTACRRVPDYGDFKTGFPVVEGSQLHSLKRANKSAVGGNDSSIRAVFDHFDLWGLFKNPEPPAVNQTALRGKVR